MLEPGQADIPEGCNFICWFESGRSPEQLVRMFETGGWRAQAVDRGYTLTKVVQIQEGGRSPRYRSYEKTLALVTATPGHANVLSGQVEGPGWMGREIRELLCRHEPQSNTLICLWRDHANGIWRDNPATPELLGFDTASLSDADQAAIAAGYIRRQVADPTQGKQASYPFVEGDLFITESVVADDEGVRHYDMFRGVFQIEWHQLREVAAEWIMQAYAPIPYATLTGDTTNLIIQEGCTGFPALLERLAELPGFPSTNFCEALKTTRYDEKEIVWRRGFPSKRKPPPKREMSPAAKDAYLSPEEIVVRVRSAFSNVRVEGPGHIAEAFQANRVAKRLLGPKLWAEELEQLRDAVTIYVDDEGGRPLLRFTAIRGRHLEVDVGDLGLNWSGYTEADQESAELSFQQLAEILGYDRSSRTDTAEPDAAADGGGM